MQNSLMSENYARTRIADWLKSALEESDISQADLAREVQKRQINLDQSKISRIINQGRGMSAEELLATAEVLKVPLPTIGAAQPEFLANDNSEAALTGFHPDLSELALEITKDLEKEEHGGEIEPDVYIEASALLYNMLKSSGAWHPQLFDIAKKMMARVKHQRNLSELSFLDYVKSVAIYYRTLSNAEKNST